jgi:hypothetical protein
MRWADVIRAFISAIAAVLLVVLAMWIWARADVLASAIASASLLTNSTMTPTRLVQAVQAIAIAAGAGGQALLLREVVPMFYSRRWMDELLQLLASIVVVGGLLAGIVLLVESGA